MAINYPGGVDSFNVPTDPEDTPLSEAGTSTRNHVEWHADAGTAIVALEQNASQLAHDHSGDSTNPLKGPQLSQVNTHQNVDTDTSTTAIHRTIGPGQFQAAAGNHTHDYNGNTILNKPYILCTSTTRPLTPEIGEIIWEQDTNRVRAWSAFPNNILDSGTSFTDTFNRVGGVAGYGATGTPSSLTAGNSGSTTITPGASDTAFLVAVTNYSSSAVSHLGWTNAVTIGGNTMTQLGVMDNFSGLTGFVALFGYVYSSPPGTTPLTVDVDMTNGSHVANLVIGAVSYANVAAFGTVVTNSTAVFAAPVNIPSSPGDIVVGIFSGSQGALSGPTGGTQRVNSFPSTSFCSLLVQDTPGALSTTLSCSVGALTNASIGVNLIVNSSNLGSNYTQAYVSGSNPTCGSMGIPVSGEATWIVGENVAARCIATCVVSGAGATISNDQDIKFTTGTAMPFGYAGLTPTIDIYLRRSSDGNTYDRLALTGVGAQLTYTTTGPSGELPLASVTAGTESTNIDWEIKVTGNTFILYRGGVQVMSFVDSGNITQSGSEYLNWSWGMSAVPGANAQIPPATVTNLSVNDLPIYSSAPIWQLLNMGAVPYVRAETHVVQEIAVNNVVAAFFDTLIEDIFGFFGLGTIGVETTISPNTDIVISESGHYDVHAGIPWDPEYYGFDQTMLGFTVNGQDIGRKNLTFMRGNGFAPGFAQTNELFMHWKFAAGDVLRVVCSHNANTPSWLFYDASSPNLQMAYVDLKFTGA